MGAGGHVPPAPSQFSVPTFGLLGIAVERGHLSLEWGAGTSGHPMWPLDRDPPAQSTFGGLGGASMS